MNFSERISSYNTWDEEKRKLEAIISLLNANGLEPNPSSRIITYLKIIDALENKNPKKLPKDFTDKKFYQIAAEIHELYDGIVELSNSTTINRWKKKFDFLVSGKELPKDDQDFKARNYQFELYIAGLLKKSGLEPICAEPDIIIDQEGSHFGIAVKRVNSFRRLDKNLRKARDQIVKTTRPGIILVDITRISNPENLITLSDSITKVTNDLIRHLDLFFEKNYSAMNNIIDNSQVFGIMLHMSC